MKTGLIIGVSLFVIILSLFLCWWCNDCWFNTLVPIFIALTGVAIVAYTAATQQLADAAKTQIAVTSFLAGGAAPFVSEAIVTVERFVREHGLSDVVPNSWVAERDDWLMIEVLNEGTRNALNVSVFWEGVTRGPQQQQGWMPSIRAQDDWNPSNFLRVDKFPPEDQLPWKEGSASDKCVWRIWLLKVNHKALLYLRKPQGGKRNLVIEWFDIMAQGERVFEVQKEEKRPGVWTTNWGNIKFLQVGPGE